MASMALQTLLPPHPLLKWSMFSKDIAWLLNLIDSHLSNYILLQEHYFILMMG